MTLNGSYANYRIQLNDNEIAIQAQCINKTPILYAFQYQSFEFMP